MRLKKSAALTDTIAAVTAEHYLSASFYSLTQSFKLLYPVTDIYPR